MGRLVWKESAYSYTPGSGDPLDIGRQESLDDSDAYRRGLRYGDEIIRFGGREIVSTNAFKNALGTYPNDWRVPLTYRRDGKEHEIRVRLGAMHRAGEIEALLDAEHEPPVPRDPRREKEPKPGEKKPAEIPGLPQKPRDSTCSAPAAPASRPPFFSAIKLRWDKSTVRSQPASTA